MSGAITIVNGFQCKDCTDIDYAKKNIDPAHPSWGPFNVNEPAQDKKGPGGTQSNSAVTFGGSLASLNATSSTQPGNSTSTNGTTASGSSSSGSTGSSQSTGSQPAFSQP